MPQSFTKKDDYARLFLSINLDTDFFLDLQKELLQLHSYAKISPAKDFHITLKFFGNVLRKDIPAIAEKISSIRSSQFNMVISGMDLFVRKDYDIIFAKIEQSEELLELKSKIDRLFGQDNFLPHITLMRLKKISNALDKNKCKEIIDHIHIVSHKFKINKIYLMESNLTQMGPVYSVLDTYEFSVLDKLH